MIGSFVILGFPLSCSCNFGKIIQALWSLVSIWILDIATVLYYIFVDFKNYGICIALNPTYLICCCCCRLVAKSYLILFVTLMDHSLPFSSTPGKNTGVGCLFLLQGIFLKGSNPCPLHCRWILYHWTTRDLLVFFFPSTQIAKTLAYSNCSKEVV